MIKTLTKSLWEYKKGSIFTILLSILEAAFEILIPLCMADLIDKGIDLGDMTAVWKFGIIILISAGLQLLTGVLSAHVAAKTSVGFSANLRQDMYDNVQAFTFSNIDKFSTAYIVTRLTTDVTNIQNAYQMLIRMAVRGPVMLIFSMIVSFRINTMVAFIFLAVIPIMALLLSMVFAMITISVASARRIAEVLEEKTDIDNPANPKMAVKDGSIRFELALCQRLADAGGCGCHVSHFADRQDGYRQNRRFLYDAAEDPC